MFLGALITSASAQLSTWLDFGGAIKGEATDSRHKDWIDIQGFTVGSSRIIPSGAGDREASRPSLTELSFAKYVDAATPALFGAATAGVAPYPKVTLDLGTRDSVTFARIELSDVLMSGQSFNASSGGETRPTESITLNFTKITYIYFPSQTKSLSSTYDIAKNLASSGSGGGPDPDSDSDGMPDFWETGYGLSVAGNDANGDLDGDGLSNLQEFQLGTLPNSGTSFFRASLSPVPATVGTYQLTWNSVVGKPYVIEWSPDLTTPFATLRTVTATAASTTENITNAGNVGFYRVRPQ
jgi:type VI secretion system secreted protein Hcp